MQTLKKYSTQLTWTFNGILFIFLVMLHHSVKHWFQMHPTIPPYYIFFRRISMQLQGDPVLDMFKHAAMIILIALIVACVLIFTDTKSFTAACIILNIWLLIIDYFYWFTSKGDIVSVLYRFASQNPMGDRSFPVGKYVWPMIIYTLVVFMLITLFEIQNRNLLNSVNKPILYIGQGLLIFMLSLSLMRTVTWDWYMFTLVSGVALILGARKEILKKLNTKSE